MYSPTLFLRPGALLLALLLAAASSASAQPRAVAVYWMWGEQPIRDAEVVFQSADGRELRATYDEGKGWYTFADSARRNEPGVVRVTHPEYESQRLRVGADSILMKCHLGLRGSEFTYVVGRRLPYMPRYGEIGIITYQSDSAEIQRMIDTLGLRVSHTEENALFVITGDTPFGRATDERLRALRRLPFRAVGPVVRIGNGLVLTNRFTVEFAPGVRWDSCVAILREMGVTGTEERTSFGTSYSPYRFTVTADPSFTHGVNNLMEPLARHPSVRQVSAELFAYKILLDAAAE